MISVVVTQAAANTVGWRLRNSDQILLGGGSRYSLMPKSFTANSQVRNRARKTAISPARRRSQRRTAAPASPRPGWTAAVLTLRRPSRFEVEGAVGGGRLISISSRSSERATTLCGTPPAATGSRRP